MARKTKKLKDPSKKWGTGGKITTAGTVRKTHEERCRAISLAARKRNAAKLNMSLDEYNKRKKAGTLPKQKKRGKYSNRAAKSEAKPASTQDQPSVLAGCPCCPSCGFNMTYMNEAYNLTQAMKRS